MKKRIIPLILIAFLISIVLIPTEAKASQRERMIDFGYSSGEGLFWYLYDGYTIPSYGYTLRVSKSYIFGSIPGSLKYKSWSEYKNKITAIKIESDVSVIGISTFTNMPNLSSVSFPSSIMYISGTAFSNCPNLRSITLPHKLISLGTHAFANTGITSVHIPTSVIEFGLNPFYGCNISSIYYCGTEQQWNQISFSADGSDWANAVLSYHCWMKPPCFDPQRCLYCSAVGTPEEHTWQDATCTQPKKCLVCNTTEGEPLGHNYSDEKSEVLREATCTNTGSIKYLCTRCNNAHTETVEKLPHSYDEGVVTREPTCNDFGERTYTCTVCGGTKIENITTAVPHQYPSWTHGNSDQHYRCCTVCGNTEYDSHTWDDGVITKEPTCVDFGERTYTCAVCGGTKIENITTAVPHQYPNWTHANSDQHYHCCTVCGNAEYDSHSWNSGVITKEPTCAEEGIRLHTCTVCGGTKEDEIDKLIDHTYDHSCDTDCNICGDVRTVSHRYSDTWIKIADKHYRECTTCGAQKDASSHVPGPAATETAPQSCTICGYIINPVLNHTHKFTDTWHLNRDGHWHNCSGCEEQQNYAPHEFDNACDTDCNVCGYERSTTHIFGTTYKCDAGGHWFVCSICGFQKETSAHEPGPEATETAPQSCTICGYIIHPVLNHFHKLTDTWYLNKDGHWHNCSGCEEQQNYAPHEFDNACDTDCNVCGYERSTTHIFGTTYKCDAGGHWLECSICGFQKETSVHEPGPNATAITAQTCTICGYEVAPPLPETTEHATQPSTSVSPNSEPSTIPTDKATNADTPSVPWLALVLIPVLLGGGAAVWYIVKKTRK